MKEFEIVYQYQGSEYPQTCQVTEEDLQDALDTFNKVTIITLIEYYEI